MGIDASIYVEGTATDDELRAAEEYMQARVGYLAWNHRPGRAVLLVRVEYDEPRVEISTGIRYYGPGYERGSWPHIYGGIRALQGAFPSRSVFYGSDCSPHGREATDEHLAELWAHWVGPQGDAYHSRSSRDE